MTAWQSTSTVAASGTQRDAPDFGRAFGAPVESLEMATPAHRNGLGALMADHTLASTSGTGRVARGLISAADSGRRPMRGLQIEPVVASTLTAAGWLHVADVLEAKAAELETSDLEIAQIYRSDAARIRAQWRRN